MTNTQLVTTGKPKTTGAVSVAPVGTTVPTDATTALNESYVNLGYISEDGLTNANSMNTESQVAWGGDTVNSSVTSKEDTFQTTFIEAKNVDVLKEVYGAGNVTGTLETGITITVNANDLVNRVWVVDMILKGGTLKRIVIPNGKITEIGDITYTDGDVTGYEVTISAEPDSAGNTHYEYIQDPTKSGVVKNSAKA